MDTVALMDDEVFGNLRRHGAPLFGPPPCGGLGLEESLAMGVALARKNAAVARVWPVALARNRAEVDVERLVALASGLGEARACGLLLWATARLMGDEALVARADLLRGDPLPEPDYFFRRDDEVSKGLDRRKTEDFARRWFFWLGGSFDDFFGACYRKHMGWGDGRVRQG